MGDELCRGASTPLYEGFGVNQNLGSEYGKKGVSGVLY